MRPARALINPDALRHNFARVRSYASLSRVMAVIKANGYGHGLVWVAKTLRDADGFGVASVEDGVALRDAGIKQPIVLLEGFFNPDELPALVKFRLDSVVHHESQLWDLEHAGKLEQPIDVWVKVDTGMHRIGFDPATVPEVIKRLKVCMSAGRVRVLSHFPCADNRFDTTTPYQVRLFEELTQSFNAERSLANSAGIVNWPSSHFEWVRPGIMLYGVTPMIGMSAADLDLRPVMTLTSEIIAVNTRHKGDAIGYGGDWVCPEDMPVGVVAIGYGDGYPRHAPPGTPVLIHGARAPIIGRVSMDMITVDLRGLPDAKVGDPVTLWGEGLPVEEIATLSGTIPYELLCCVTPRVPRIERTAAG
jgi:alanine racemase